MYSKITNRARLFAAAFSMFAVAASVIASPVVVTPGASAGYLYFAPAPTGQGSGQSTTDPKIGTCGEAKANGDECTWGDGAIQVLAAINSGGYKKLFLLKSKLSFPIGRPTCGAAASSQTDGAENTERMAQSNCPPALTCRSLGNDVFMPAINQLGLLVMSKNQTGFSYDTRGLWSSTVSGNYYSVIYSSGNIGREWGGDTFATGSFTCVRGIL